MKFHLATLIWFSLVSTLAAPGADLKFAAEAGVSMRRTLQEDTTWTLESMQQVVDGRPLREETPPMTGGGQRRLTVLDTYAAVDGGVATKLAREFEEIAGKSTLDFDVDGTHQSFVVNLASELEGAKVLFERKDKDSEPTAKFASESEASSKLLEGLREDLDLRAFLTETGLTEGDYWKVDVASLADVLAPGGDLMLDPEQGALPKELAILDAYDVLGTTLCALRDNTGDLAGEVLCTWKDTTKDGERELAVIELEWEATSKTQASELLARRFESSGAASNRVDLEVTSGVTTEGIGQLVWDLTANRAASFALTLDTQFDIRFGFTEQGAKVSFQVALSGKSELKGEFAVQ